MDYKRNKKYFQPTKLTWPVTTIIIGLIFFLSDATQVFGFFLLVAGGLLVYLKLRGRPTDAEIDAVFSKEVKIGFQRALAKLGVDEEEVHIIDPIAIEGPNHTPISTAVLHKQGKDGQWRASNYEAIILYFSERQVYAYSYRFSIIASERNESTDEYFYRDIVSVSTSSDNVSFQDATGKLRTINAEAFKLTTSGGTSINCSIRDAASVEKSINGMKQLLREKKSA